MEETKTLITGEQMNDKNILYMCESEVVNAPLWWHKQGLQQTASGYGSKLTSRFKVPYNGRLYRVYYICYSNLATYYIVSNGNKIIIRVI